MNTETSTKELFITLTAKINQVKALCIAHPDYNFFSATLAVRISHRHSNTAVAQYTKSQLPWQEYN